MKRLIIAALCFSFVCSIAVAQQPQPVVKTKVEKRKMYPHFSVSPTGGAIFPLPKVLDKQFKPGAIFGLDMGYRINKEVAIFGDVAYAFMTSKTTGAPVGSYIIAYAGPRYYFTHPKLKSALFFEGGVGAYNFNQKSYSTETGQAIDQINNTKAGLTGGIGGSLAISDNVDVLAKGNYHTVFTPNGSSSFVTVQGGIELRFR